MRKLMDKLKMEDEKLNLELSHGIKESVQIGYWQKTQQGLNNKFTFASIIIGGIACRSILF